MARVSHRGSSTVAQAFTPADTWRLIELKQTSVPRPEAGGTRTEVTTAFPINTRASCSGDSDADVDGAKKEFLIVYDYRSGGLWGFMRARSAEEILAKYPELSVERQRPSWLTDDLIAEIKRAETHDIDEDPSGLLNAVLAERNRN
jgi:hypothetical protein